MSSMTSQQLILWLFLNLWCLRAGAHGGNGMDMSMDGPMALGHGNMLPYLHFTRGDILWFIGWVPLTARAMVGICIALFLLGLFERWLAVSRVVIELHWDKRAQIALSNKRNAITINSQTTQRKHSIIDVLTMHRLPPFIWAHDVSRGILQTVQSSIGFVFMLTVMTFQVSFILAIVAGLGVGEMMFGRFADAAAHLDDPPVVTI